jgi:hypothetical protein
MTHHGSGSGDDCAAEWKIGESAQRGRNAWRDKDAGEEASEQSIWIANDLAAQGWEGRVCRCTDRVSAINQECPLLIIKQACATLINNEASCQRTEGGEDRSAPLFTKFNTGEQASPTDRMRRLRQRALLQASATRFKCGESTGERRRLRLCSAGSAFTLSNGCASGGGARLCFGEFA